MNVSTIVYTQMQEFLPTVFEGKVNSYIYPLSHFYEPQYFKDELNGRF